MKVYRLVGMCLGEYELMRVGYPYILVCLTLSDNLKGQLP